MLRWFPLLALASTPLLAQPRQAQAAQVTALQATQPAQTLPPQTSPAQPASAPATAAPASSVEPIASMRDQPATRGKSIATSAHAKIYTITVGSGDWVDTGADVAFGEGVTFSATGSQTLATGGTATPEGLDRGWKDLLRQFPLNQARTGALIGRVSDMAASVPFSIGSSATLPMPTSGRLFLRANLTSDLAGSGSFTVRITFPEPATAHPNSAATTGQTTTPTQPISVDLAPSLFDNIPRRVGDEAGNPGDMVNYALVGSQAQVLAAFKAAGWVAVDKSVGDAVLHGLVATLSHEAYTEVPMSTLFLFGRPQDLSFARGDPLTVAAERHHLRVWKSPETIHGLPLWVGSATHDIGFEKDQRNGKTTHKIDPAIDSERQFLLSSFDAAGAFSSAAYVTPANPLREARTATGGEFHSDGRIVVMQLK